MHAVTLAITPHLARLAVARTHPFAVTELFEAFFPHLPERITVDIALIVVATYAKAARNGAIGTN